MSILAIDPDTKVGDVYRAFVMSVNTTTAGKKHYKWLVGITQLIRDLPLIAFDPANISVVINGLIRHNHGDAPTYDCEWNENISSPGYISLKYDDTVIARIAIHKYGHTD